MLTAEKNERLTRVGPGTPMGNLLRRYWHPIAAAGELEGKAAIPIRILGEDLVLFRDKQDKLGLIGNRCAHRLVEMQYGFVVEEGLRCPYHGWAYDITGQCTSQPAEAQGSNFKDKIKLTSYPVQERSGLVFAYLGPQPVPLMPWWDRMRPSMGFKSFKVIQLRPLPCNWFNIMDNIGDTSHSQWLHGNYYKHVLEQAGVPREDPQWVSVLTRVNQKQTKFTSDRIEQGFTYRTMVEGLTEEDEMWKVGVVQSFFPNAACLAQSGTSYTVWTVPIDDTQAIQYFLEHYYFDAELEVPEQRTIPYFAYPAFPRDEKGERQMASIFAQDNYAIAAQGVITDRTQERLGESDKDIIKHRELFFEQLAIVEGGGEPMNVFRDRAELERMEAALPPPIGYWYNRGRSPDGSYYRGATTATGALGGPYSDAIEDLFVKESELIMARRKKAEAKEHAAT